MKKSVSIFSGVDQGVNNLSSICFCSQQHEGVYSSFSNECAINSAQSQFAAKLGKLLFFKMWNYEASFNQNVTLIKNL